MSKTPEILPLPCPFCGANLQRSYDERWQHGLPQSCIIGNTLIYDDKVSLWNRRASPSLAWAREAREALQGCEDILKIIPFSDPAVKKYGLNTLLQMIVRPALSALPSDHSVGLNDMVPSSRLDELREAVIQEAKDALKDLLMGFVQCRKCGNREDLKTLACVKPLSKALSDLAAEEARAPGVKTDGQALDKR